MFLGGLLLDNNAFDLVADVIGPDDFYRHDHRLIYEKIQQMCTAGQPADVVTVFTALDSEGKAQETGGLAYLSNLATGTPSAANIRRYAEIVRDRSILRQLVTAATRSPPQRLPLRPGTSRSSLTRPRASSWPLTKSPTRVRRVSAS